MHVHHLSSPLSSLLSAQWYHRYLHALLLLSLSVPNFPLLSKLSLSSWLVGESLRFCSRARSVNEIPLLVLWIMFLYHTTLHRFNLVLALKQVCSISQMFFFSSFLTKFQFLPLTTDLMTANTPPGSLSCTDAEGRGKTSTQSNDQWKKQVAI